ncbi:hypothetical protein OPV22_011902 [Ensete ventricosum]|uniref:Uncharacterized protein n=1 Tax=Ensete ventricosum TaxID=4639 RepID=A0AAV8Q6L4_ENSVE|nr:hypothetical protein OPV22_011902 [Ensete ventricosum]
MVGLTVGFWQPVSCPFVATGHGERGNPEPLPCSRSSSLRHPAMACSRPFLMDSLAGRDLDDSTKEQTRDLSHWKGIDDQEKEISEGSNLSFFLSASLTAGGYSAWAEQASHQAVS